MAEVFFAPVEDTHLLHLSGAFDFNCSINKLTMHFLRLTQKNTLC